MLSRSSKQLSRAGEQGIKQNIVEGNALILYVLYHLDHDFRALGQSCLQTPEGESTVIWFLELSDLQLFISRGQKCLAQGDKSSEFVQPRVIMRYPILSLRSL